MDVGLYRAGSESDTTQHSAFIPFLAGLRINLCTKILNDYYHGRIFIMQLCCGSFCPMLRSCLLLEIKYILLGVQKSVLSRVPLYI